MVHNDQGLPAVLFVVQTAVALLWRTLEYCPTGKGQVACTLCLRKNAQTLKRYTSKL